MNDSRPPNSKRRWYQVSVRTVLVAVLVLSLLLSWLRARAERNRQARAELHRVASQIWNQGGDIDYEYARRRPNRLEKLVDDPGVFDVKEVSTGADLQLLQGLDGMLHSWKLSLSGSGVTDAELKHLQKLKGLRELDLTSPEITDAGLEHLQGLTDLRVLRVWNGRVTAEGISNLEKALPNARIIPSPTQFTAIAEIKRAGGEVYWSWRFPHVRISFSRSEMFSPIPSWCPAG